MSDKVKRINTTMLESEHHKIKDKAHKQGMSVSEFIRYKCLYQEDNKNGKSV